LFQRLVGSLHGLGDDHVSAQARLSLSGIQALFSISGPLFFEFPTFLLQADVAIASDSNGLSKSSGGLVSSRASHLS
jgi:hypothetical protein